MMKMFNGYYSIVESVFSSRDERWVHRKYSWRRWQKQGDRGCRLWLPSPRTETSQWSTGHEHSSSLMSRKTAPQIQSQRRQELAPEQQSMQHLHIEILQDTNILIDQIVCPTHNATHLHGKKSGCPFQRFEACGTLMLTFSLFLCDTDCRNQDKLSNLLTCYWLKHKSEGKQWTVTKLWLAVGDGSH